MSVWTDKSSHETVAVFLGELFLLDVDFLGVVLAFVGVSNTSFDLLLATG